MRKVILIILSIIFISVSPSATAHYDDNYTNAAEIYKEIAKNLKGVPDNKELSRLLNAALDNDWGNDKERVKRMVSENKANLERFREATLLKNYDITFGNPKQYYEAPTVLDLPAPSYWDEVAIAKLSLLEGKIFESEGKLQQALADYISVLRLTDQMRKQTQYKNIMGSVISNVFQNLAFSALEDFINNNAVTLNMYEELFAYLNSFRMESYGSVYAIEGEKDFHIKTLPTLRREFLEEISDEERMNQEEKEVFVDKIIAEFERLHKEAWGYMIFAARENDLEYLDEKIGSLQKRTEQDIGQYNLKAKAIKNIFNRQKNEDLSAEIVGKMLFLTGFPNARGLITKFYVIGTKIDLLQLACAIKIYEIKNGFLPSSLDDLTPVYMPEIFIDSFDKPNPLKYRLIDDGVLIYSVGPDKIDDKAEKAIKDERDTEGKGDIVLEISR